MVCHHRPGDPAHGAYERESMADETRAAKAQVAKLQAEAKAREIDNQAFEVLRAQEVGGCLVLMVLYKSCPGCTYEGKKVMVYREATALSAIRWRKIDPHFREKSKMLTPSEAPGPDARFPASEDGWKDATAWAAGQPNTTTRGRRSAAPYGEVEGEK